MVEVSLGGLFLLEAAQKTDRMFSVHSSSKHTIRDAQSDILKMTKHLMDLHITEEQERTGVFVDPTDNGWRKMSDEWLEKVLSKSLDVEEELQESTGQDLDIGCELYDTY